MACGLAAALGRREQKRTGDEASLDISAGVVANISPEERHIARRAVFRPRLVAHHYHEIDIRIIALDAFGDGSAHEYGNDIRLRQQPRLCSFDRSLMMLEH